MVTINIVRTTIPGCLILEPELHTDDRGIFRRNFDAQLLAKAGAVNTVEQCNISENRLPLTLRGFHYQIGEHGENKTLSCARGAVQDIVVDLRKESPTYMKWEAFDVNESNRISVHIPAGCANALLTLQADTVVHYYVSHRYTPEAERGIRYNDPAFNFVWRNKPEVISEKDASWPDYQ